MGLLSSGDKEKIKIALPKSFNKIIYVSVARLYIAYPNPDKWQYTGLTGSIALVDDLVGNTFFFKLIDINGNRGVIWDQELYINFEYFQDRTFFHTFELEDCMAGLLFEDIGEAQHFYKRVVKREKYASKKTLSNNNAIALNKSNNGGGNKSSSNSNIHGPRGESLISDQRQRYDYDSLARKKAPPPPPPSTATTSATTNVTRNNSSKSAARNESTSANTPDVPAESTSSVPVVHHVPPPPDHYVNPTPSTNPDLEKNRPENNKTTQSVNMDTRFAFPIPQMKNFGSSISAVTPVAAVPPPLPAGNRPALPQRNVPQPSSPVLPNRYNAIPAVGGAFPPPLPPSRRGPVPAPPPRRTTAALPTINGYTQQEPYNNTNLGRAVPPAPPKRGPVPPPPPRAARPTPSLPNRVPSNPVSYGQPQQYNDYNTRLQQQQQQQQEVPYDQSAYPPSQNQIPMAPPMPSMGQSAAAPPPPPPMPTMGQNNSNNSSGLTETTGDAGRDALLASIRGAGGINSLKKIDKSQLDRPSVLLQEGKDNKPGVNNSNGASTSGGGGPPSLADALAAALNSRKAKVSYNGDDDGGDW
ncbi:uncharacterized protein SCODWIG_03881 [Saccharomycodes ludwigii]|uniref:Proline-rich protein LAS17 n=1 Tax=Saccharomycodes ludwigii TaxID=36035 RepID=A0A376BC02_9ASCO|nr:uncharacterized protein SCODWIG_03881 [Saccharomycodes ludwigii]